jgi:hypothetical protein
VRVFTILLLALSIACATAAVSTNRYHLTLAWTPSSNAVAYSLYLATNASAPYQRALTTTNTSATVSNLPNTRLFLVATAIGPGGQESDFSRTAPWQVQTYWHESSSNLSSWWIEPNRELIDPPNPALFTRTVLSNWNAASAFLKD